MSLHLRPAIATDTPVILGFIRELAAYEKLLDHCVATEHSLAVHLFGANPKAEVIMAEWEGAPVGFALFFHNYSSFRAQPGIYLEDIFVKPEFRGVGIGKGLITTLAKLAVDRDCGRLEWSVLDWNAPAIAFYRNLGAVQMDEWTIMRVTEDALTRLATLASQGTING